MDRRHRLAERDVLPTNGAAHIERTVLISSHITHGDEHDFANRCTTALTEANLPCLLDVSVSAHGRGEMAYRALPAPKAAWPSRRTRPGGSRPRFSTKFGRALMKRSCAGAMAPPVAVERPGPEKFSEMMTCCVGEAVPPKYDQMMAEELGFEGERFRAGHRSDCRRPIGSGDRRWHRWVDISTRSSCGRTTVRRSGEKRRCRRGLAHQSISGRRRGYAQPPLLMVVLSAVLECVLRQARRSTRVCAGYGSRLRPARLHPILNVRSVDGLRLRKFLLEPSRSPVRPETK